MQKILNNIFLFSFVFLSIQNLGYSKIDLKENRYEIIRNYLKEWDKFSKNFCSAGEDHKYYQLLSNYRGNGHYLPLDDDQKIYFPAIEKNLNYLKSKEEFIESLISQLDKLEKFPEFKPITNSLINTFEDLLKIKKDHYKALNKEAQEKALEKSKRYLAKFKQEFNAFTQNIFFLKTFNFPNNHLKNRYEYELLKYSESKEDHQKALIKYFYRRIVEDGTHNSSNHYPDIFIRTTLDNLYIEINALDGLITDEVRANLDWVLKKVESFLSEGRFDIRQRLSFWLLKTRKAHEYYKNLLKNKNSKETLELVRLKNSSTKELKEYVLEKSAKVYHYWKNKDELNRILFVLDTILFNEVGSVDSDAGLERKDVVSIVLNRKDHPKYNYLPEKQELTKKILSLEAIDLNKYKWLNVLFKEGEFSFTYYYISSVVKIFCPDRSRNGKRLREKNLKIILSTLKNPDLNFNGLRYFSQISMLGKINMAKVWHEYKPYPERAGWPSDNQQRLALRYKTDRYRYLYSFQDPKNISYDVVEIEDKTYSLTFIKGSPVFYQYRNPYLFRYFYSLK